ncbi:hypothetical protein Bhz55_00109 [Stenotrophomonas phage vB_SmaS_Bhz55]
MSYHVLTAVPTGMHAHGYTRIALIEYTGTLPPERLKINPRFKGLRVVKCGIFNHVGEDTAAKRVQATWEEEARILNRK